MDILSKLKLQTLQSTRYLKKIYFTLILVGLLFGLIFAIYSLVSSQPTQFSTLFIMWGIIALFLSLLPIIWLLQTRRLLESNLRLWDSTIKHNRQEAFHTLTSRLKPRVDYADGFDEVSTVASRMISEACDQVNVNQRFAVFLGSASLLTLALKYDEFGPVPSDIRIGHQKYRSALEAATKSRLKIRRWLRLIHPDDLLLRSFEFQREYIDWLRYQEYMLIRNPNYIIADTSRALQWRSSIAYIFTDASVLEITGKGEIAIQVIDPLISEAIRRNSREFLETGKYLPNRYGQHGTCNKSVNDFSSYIQLVNDTLIKRH